ncbi:MAG: heme ABC transporter ATP-binding protein [Oceanospirillaceae bacterium]|uniref:heme ABC transporter ATP-binding protein n=1 Tax=unclassified Thalassolituus TaxID=2624967 RepID=UPI000C3C95D4|nr:MULTISPECIES: heme ABC transporter ATP-binding protein [unclassified Thalassolituus]MBL34677.1 heme ABC transporter ATP-binding protein [Oceanospirillaceae bacterium]MBS52453.1 heme ABC transporter ATP-binding protein [Oceanospirillaceae bacterium]|tara:strand:+ start:4581 stop:5369 length:789 start_codon:yes stop_codon:yes gene_type:complete
MLKVKNLTVQLGSRAVLQDVHLSVEPGKCTAVLGANGAGKSTLLNCLCAHNRACCDAVSLDGVTLDQFSGLERAKRMAVMPQSVTLSFPMRVHQVVAMGRSPYGDEKQTQQYQRDAMQLTGVWHLRERVYPTLSGGEQQRVQLARVLVQIWQAWLDRDRAERADTQHYYLLLDECTSALDPAHQHSVMQIVREFAQAGVGVLAVMHDISLAASWADSVVMMKQGRIVAGGDQSVLMDPHCLQQVYDLPLPLAQAYSQQCAVW